MTEKSFLTWKIHDAMMRMLSSPEPQSKVKWAKVMNEAKRERGDFDHIAEAKRERLDQPGERTDE